ncbi:TQXA domain-containing protein [Microlunatus elymi]|uniref:TQXA domain-containing protein n=1 Tax=Microlunatus elymi TaxID=2596828 RepID=A0A516PVH2_9ACTN|nr:thioester domain-containing protein [Microlunatus elymi]QDP95163.1 TQXA domain-containing protein [Microlunatus elymi]
MRSFFRAAGALIVAITLCLLATGTAAAIPGNGPAPSIRGDNTQITFTSLGPGQAVRGYIADLDNPFDSSVEPYPSSDPTAGFSPLNESFAGILRGTPAGGGAETSLYCIDIRTTTQIGIGYELGTWDESNVPNVGLVARILNEYYPQTDAPAGLTTNQRAAAVQAAIWYFTDKYVLAVIGHR